MHDAVGGVEEQKTKPAAVEVIVCQFYICI